MREITVRGHYRTYNGKKRWIDQHPRKIKDEVNKNLKEYAVRFSFKFPTGYVKKIKAKDEDELSYLTNRELDSVLMNPDCSGGSHVIGEWDDYKKEINQKRAKTMKHKVEWYASNKKESENLGLDSSTWDYPYKKNWKFLKEDTK